MWGYSRLSIISLALPWPFLSRKYEKIIWSPKWSKGKNQMFVDYTTWVFSNFINVQRQWPLQPSCPRTLEDPRLAWYRSTKSHKAKTMDFRNVQRSLLEGTMNALFYEFFSPINWLRKSHVGSPRCCYGSWKTKKLNN